jgi:DNA replication protein DnaC
VCRDTRWVRHDVPVGHPEFGKARPCACTTEDPEVRAAQYRERLRVSGLPVALYDRRLDTFVVLEASTRAAHAAVRDFVAARRTGGDPLWITLFGAPGRGKSHLLAAAANALLPRQAATYWAVPELLRACKDGAQVDGEYRPFAVDQQLTALAKVTPVLILDEFGAPAADRVWQWEKLDLLVKHREAARTPLLLGMSCSPEELRATAPAIASRLTDKTLGRVVVIEAPDYRPRLGTARPARAPEEDD